MKNTSTYLVVCPHCGEVKRVAFSTVRWNDVTYVFWSDGRIESEEWCEPAYIQQCPVCKYFFPLPPRNSLPVEKAPCDDTGFLPYQTLKQAVEELAGNEKQKSMQDSRLGGHIISIIVMLTKKISLSKKENITGQICSGSWIIIPRRLQAPTPLFLNFTDN